MLVPRFVESATTLYLGLINSVVPVAAPSQVNTVISRVFVSLK